VLTALSFRQKKIKDEECVNYECSARGTDAVDKQADLLRAADAAFVVGAVGAVLGTFLIWHSSRARVSTQAGATSVVSTVTMVLP
jgi:hypothetical protein